VTLTPQQQQAVDAAVESIKAGRLYRLGGYAGTGKTTVAKDIAGRLDQGMFCAFTGKAAYRLRQKGLSNTATIHRTIYDYDRTTLRFCRKQSVPGKYFLIDEASMISHRLWCDLNVFDKPILLLGDPGQLEPVGSDPRLMHDPDMILTDIHRQAAGSAIIQFATDIRLGNYHRGKTYGDGVDIIRGQRPTYKDIEWADIVLCGYNRTRMKVNNIVRAQRGYRGLLCEGEQLICLRNNIELGVFNGQLLTVQGIVDRTEAYTKVQCVPDGEDSPLTLKLLNAQFGAKPLPYSDLQHLGQDIAVADYGYCITCHKSQGSEWDKVVVIDEQCPRLWNSKRWRYTAITRAAKELRYYFR